MDIDTVCYIVVPFHWTFWIAFALFLILSIAWYLSVRILIRAEAGTIIDLYIEERGRRNDAMYKQRLNIWEMAAEDERKRREKESQ